MTIYNKKTKYCKHCASEILKDAIVCPKCGLQVEELKIEYVHKNIHMNNYKNNNLKERNKWIAFLLCLFLGIIGATNYEYLFKLKQMVKKAGLNYYAKILWKKDDGHKRSTGRMTKECEEIMIFYKGKKARKLSRESVSAYRTREMLPFINPYYSKKGNNRNHDNEKPVELYEFLINMLTEEKEVLLDQFGGACNMLKAAINKNRFSIVYEIFDKFVQKAVEGLIVLH